MAHMPRYGQAGATCQTCDTSCGGTRIVTYTITGSEANSGVDFMVPIGATLADDDYEVGFFGTAGSSLMPVIDFPNAVESDRTTTHFRVLLASALGIGDILKFMVIAACATTPAAEEAPLMFAIIGQSNAEGRADIADVTSVTGFETPVLAIDLAQMMGTSLTVYADGPLQPRTPDVPVPNDFGIELSMGRLLAATGRTIDIVKVAIGGSSLQGDWLGPDNYTLDAMAFVTEKEVTFGSQLAALIWIQGETDATNPVYAANYESNLTTMIGLWRAQWPGVPFVIVKLSSSNIGTYKNDVRAAQVAVAGAGPDVSLVDADDLTNDGLHFDANALITLGKRCALSALGLLGITAPADPDPEAPTSPSVVTNKSGATHYGNTESIVVDFDNVPGTDVNSFFAIATDGTGSTAPYNDPLWLYTDGSHSLPPAALVVDGQVTFTPATFGLSNWGAGGTFVVRMYDGGSTLDFVTESAAFTIDP